MSGNERGRVALVTGASRGLGAAIAEKLAADGARVAVNYWGSPEKAQGVVGEIRARGGTAEAFRADVRDEKEVAALVDAVKQEYGPVDILVVNATGPQPFVRIEDLSWRTCLD